MRRWVRRAFVAFLLVPAIPLLFIGAGFVGALVPGDVGQRLEPASKRTDKTKKVLLISTLLHADLLFPVDEKFLQKFGFLAQTDFPFQHPQLKYVGVGWGSKAFYTTAGSLTEIEPGITWTAVTGDDAVLRFAGFADATNIDGAITLHLTESQYDKLLAQIVETLAQPGVEGWMRGATIADGDAFFHAKGHFNIFHPCNQWTNRILRRAGLPLGAWTPTAQSLRLSLHAYSSGFIEQ